MHTPYVVIGNSRGNSNSCAWCANSSEVVQFFTWNSSCDEQNKNFHHHRNPAQETISLNSHFLIHKAAHTTDRVPWICSNCHRLKACWSIYNGRTRSWRLLRPNYDGAHVRPCHNRRHFFRALFGRIMAAWPRHTSVYRRPASI